MSIPDEKLARWAALPRPSSVNADVNVYTTPDGREGVFVEVFEADWPNRDRPEMLNAAADRDFIAHAPEMREAIDELVAELRRMQEALEWVKENVRGRAWFVANAALSGTPSHEMSTKWEPRGHYIECSCGWRSQPSENLDTAEQDAHIHAVETGEAAP